MGFTKKVFLGILVVATCVVFVVDAKEGEVGRMLFFHEWEQWKNQYGRLYSSQVEHDARYNVFEQNLKFVNEWNSEGNSSFTLGLNRFADLTNDEFVDLLGSPMEGDAKQQSLISRRNLNKGTRKPGSTEALDYRDLGAVTPVKNQGQCGSCWAFSIVAACEGANALHGSGELIELSEQQVADCSVNGGNSGCNGGDPRSAMEYIIKYGLQEGYEYPYRQYTGRCRYNVRKVAAKYRGMVLVQEGDENDLTEAVKEHGPVSVAIDAGRRTFQFYKSGVYYDPLCSSTKLDHGVAVVGYYGDDDVDYWIVKNSWGTGWGEDGYVRIARNKDNHCGIATYATAVVSASRKYKHSA